MSEHMCYIGVKPCGCVVAMASGDPRYRDGLDTDLAEWIRDGLDIQRATVEDCRVRVGPCRCGDSLDLFEESKQ